MSCRSKAKAQRIASFLYLKNLETIYENGRQLQAGDISRGRWGCNVNSVKVCPPWQFSIWSGAMGKRSDCPNLPRTIADRHTRSSVMKPESPSHKFQHY